LLCFAMEAQTKSRDFKHIVRVGGTDLEGKKQLLYALCQIKGISYLMSNAICSIAGIDRTKLAGELSEAEVEKLDDIIRNPQNYEIPGWLKNRRFDYETGQNMHLFGPDVKFTEQSDIKRLKKIKSYKGFRHSKGLPVRGQRTKSNFRKNKGKSMGVQRKKTGKKR